MLIVGVLHQRELGRARNIAHTVRKGIDDVQRCAAQLSSSVILPCRALLAIRVHRPVDNPCALLVRAINGTPIEALVPNDFRLRFRLLNRRRRFLIKVVIDRVREVCLAVDADRCEVRVPTRQCIGCGGVCDNSVVLVLKGRFHFVVDIYVKVEVSLYSTDRVVVR